MRNPPTSWWSALTGFRRVEQALWASEERNRVLLEHAPDAIVLFDFRDGRFLDCNSAAERLFGLPRAELLQRGPIELSPVLQPGGRTSAEAGAGHIREAAGGATPVFEWTHCDATGREIPCEVRLVRLPCTERALIRGSVIDVSQRKQAERRLRESEQRFQSLVENSNELILQVKLDGTIVYASPNHESITGRRPADMVGRNVFENLHPDDLREVREKFLSGNASGVFRYRFRDGTWHWLESSGRRYELANGEARGVIVSRDVSARTHAEEERKRLEAQLRQSQKMEAIGTLAGGIAHDFNNILTGLLGYLQLIEMEIPPGPNSIRQSVAEALGAGNRAKDLVAQILAFSRQQEQQREVVAPAPIVGEAMRLLRASLPSTIAFRTEISAGTFSILADATQLHQVLMNLGANAAHAMRAAGGTLTVTLAPHDAPVALVASNPQLRGGHTLRLSVADTGLGMAPEIRERIFEPFFTTKPAGEGTGLGLSIVHGIIRDHDGAIDVESTPGRGTTFHIYLPILKTAEAAPISSSVPKRGQGERVLLVDDEMVVLSMGKQMLQRLGYLVTACSQSSAALRAFEAHPENFDLVIADLTMPGFTGVELIAQARRIRPALPVVLTTGYMREADLEPARAIGIQHVLAKPFTLLAFAEIVHTALPVR